MPEPPPPGSSPTCDSAGILGTIIGVIASFESNEALKILSGPEVLALQCAFDDMSKVALGRHVGGPRL